MSIVARLDGVTRAYGKLIAVDDVSLTLEAGRIYGLLGPNGSGKTTTLTAMLGLVPTDRGEVTLFGGPPDDERRARLGYVPEERALPDSYPVRDTLTFFLRMRGRSLAEAREGADHWIERLALTDKAKARIDTLSNGQQQKVQIALALCCEPDLLLLDEPMTALDPGHQELVTGLFLDAAARGAAVLLSTHRLAEAEAWIDHVLLMSGGRKVLDAPLASALRDGFEGIWRVQLRSAQADAGWIPGPDVLEVTREHDVALVRLRDPDDVAPLLARAAAAGAPVLGLTAQMPSLQAIYLRHAETSGGPR